MRPFKILTRDGKHFVATAYFAAHGPVVAERWQRGVAAAGKTDFSAEEATAMNNKAVDDSLCQLFYFNTGHRRTSPSRSLSE